MKMDALQPHNCWIVLAAVRLILLLVVVPLCRWGIIIQQHRAESIVKERGELHDSAERFQEDVQLAERPDSQISTEDMERLLSPVDRLRVVEGLEQQATAARFSHFTYNLAPEKPADVDVVAATDLVTNHLELATDMPLDSDAYAFLQNLNYVLPGRVHLRHLTLIRLTPDAPLSLANVHMTAELEWLSNKALSNQGKVP